MSEKTGKGNGSSMKRFVRPVPHEGENGLFSQTWFAICKSDEVPIGGVIGRDFLDGRVAIYRGIDGVAQVLSAYCPHIGADLSMGTVSGNDLRCPFHHWEYNREGRCVRTGIGDPPPARACLFRFPTVEEFGVIWAFNGEEPLFELARPSRPLEHLVMHVADPFPVSSDPWVICANTPDWAHFATVHRFDFPREGQNESLKFEDFGVRRHFTAKLEFGQGPDVTFDVTVRGTAQVLIEGQLEGRWFAVMGCMGLPRPGRTNFFITAMVDRRESGSDEQAAEDIRKYAGLAQRMGGEDAPIWETIHFKQGFLTRADQALGVYLDQLRSFPRAHPSAEFIN